MAGATAFAIALTRLVPLAKGPWDWDEVLFCLSLREYNVALHQPHPLGFPLYVLMGRIARFFTGSDFHALQAVNVAVAMLAFPLMFWLARAFRFDFSGAMIAGAIFAFLPNVWFYGGTAFSDVPGAIFFLAVIAAYLTAGDRPRRYYLASALFGAAICIRPQNGLVAVFPWLIASLQFYRVKRIRPLVTGSAIVAGVVIAGYGAAALATGVEDYVYAVRGHSQYVTHADSIASEQRDPVWEVFLRQFDPYYAGKVSYVMAFFLVVALVRGRRNVVHEVLLTFAPFFFFTIFATNPLGSSRFALNYVAGIVLLSVEGMRVAARWLPRFELPLRVAFATVVLARFIYWTLPAFEVPRKAFAPPVAAAMWINEHVPRTSLIFVDESIWPWLRYFAPHHEMLHVYNAADVVHEPRARTGWFVAIGTSTADGARMFMWPKNRTWNVVTQRCFEAFVQPANDVINYASGWYGPEANELTIWRWATNHAVIEFPPRDGNVELSLDFQIPYDGLRKPVFVTFTLNGRLLERFEAKGWEFTRRWIVPARADRLNELRIDVNGVVVPAPPGAEGDHRSLAFMLRGVSWKPTGTPVQSVR